MEEQVDLWNKFLITSARLDKKVNGLEERHKMPVMEVGNLGQHLALMVSKLTDMTRICSAYMMADNAAAIESCQRRADEVHLHQKFVTAMLYDQDLAMGRNTFKMVARFPSRLERISLTFKSILTCWQANITDGMSISQKAREELSEIFEAVIEVLESLRDGLLTPDKFLLEHMKSRTQKLKRLIEDARLANWQRLDGGICRPERASTFAETLDCLRNLNEYCGRMYESLLYLVLESETAAAAENTDK